MSKKSSNFAAAKRLRFLEGEPMKAIRIAYMLSTGHILSSLREGFECKVNDITKLL